jgi:CheY-like chemotaxis protein
MIINPNDKPVIPHHNQALRDISKSNTRSHSLIYTNGLNLVGLRRKSRRSLSPSPHQITINNNVNTRNSLILTNPNEDSSFSGLSMVKQEVAVSIEGKNYDHNVLSPTFHGNASGMNCNRIFSAYNYHKTKSHITSFAGSRNLIAKNESKPTVSYTTGSSNDNGASGLKKNHSFKKNLAVLVVDDDENFQKSYKRVIENLGVDDVTCINDGLDLLMMFLKSELNNYDVIIMDNFIVHHDIEIMELCKKNKLTILC